MYDYTNYKFLNNSTWFYGFVYIFEFLTKNHSQFAGGIRDFSSFIKSLAIKKNLSLIVIHQTQISNFYEFRIETTNFVFN